jgi:mRNA interferase HigB
VRVISRKALSDFWEQPAYRDAEQPLRAWFAEADRADWKTTAEIRRTYRTADFVANGRVIFNIGGNKYRLIVAFRYPMLFIRFVGTHKQYDKIDPTTV